MIIFGIDPGTAVTGYGVIKTTNNSVSWVDSGVITTDTAEKLPVRLEMIYDRLFEKIRQHKPQRVCIEEAFYGKNVHTTLVLGHARGVAMLAAQKTGAQIVEYSPREVKKAITGNGDATKDQIAYMVRIILSPPVEYSHLDAYDALAIAVGDFHMAKTDGLKKVYLK